MPRVVLERVRGFPSREGVRLGGLAKGVAYWG